MYWPWKKEQNDAKEIGDIDHAIETMDSVKKVGSASKYKDKYLARVYLRGRQRHVGYFGSLEECYLANKKYLEVNDFTKAAKNPIAWAELSNRSHNSILERHGVNHEH